MRQKPYMQINILLEVMAGEESDALELLNTLTCRERQDLARAAEHLAILAGRPPVNASIGKQFVDRILAEVDHDTP